MTLVSTLHAWSLSVPLLGVPPIGVPPIGVPPPIFAFSAIETVRGL
jgi:hypothetical protein